MTRPVFASTSAAAAHSPLADRRGGSIAVRLVPRGHSLSALAGYLDQLQSSRAFPRPRDFDIVSCRRYVGWIHLLDVVNEQDRIDYLFAIYGSRMLEMTGHDYQGWRVSEISDLPRREHLLEVLDRVRINRKPEFRQDRTRGPIRLRASQAFDRLVWPLSSDGETIDRILMCLRPY